MAAEAAPLIDQVEIGGDASSDASETSSLMGREVERGMLARKVGSMCFYCLFFISLLLSPDPGNHGFSWLCKCVCHASQPFSGNRCHGQQHGYRHKYQHC